MKRKPCRDVLLDYFKVHPNQWIKKVDLFVICYEYSHSPVSTDRRLMEMENEGLIKVGKYNGKYTKNLAQYCYGGVPVTKTIYHEVEIDGERRMIAKQETVLV